MSDVPVKRESAKADAVSIFATHHQLKLVAGKK
jgi:hypothetical protein